MFYLTKESKEFSLVHASYSLPKWQAVKLTFFAPCMRHLLTTVSDAPLASALSL